MNEGITILNTDTDSHVHKKEWEKIVKLYENNSNTWKIEQLTLSVPSGESHSENISKLKEECRKLLDTNLNSENISDKEALEKNWCIRDAKGSLTKQ